MAATTEDAPPPPSILPLGSHLALSTHLAAHAHTLATPQGDPHTATAALDLARRYFDIGVGLEREAWGVIHPLLGMMLDGERETQTRSQTRRQKQGKLDARKKPAEKPTDVLPFTPLDALYTDGMSYEQVWDQLEMRGASIQGMMRVVGGEAAAEADEDEAGGIPELSDESDEDDSDEAERELAWDIPEEDLLAELDADRSLTPTERRDIYQEWLNRNGREDETAVKEYRIDGSSDEEDLSADDDAIMEGSEADEDDSEEDGSDVDEDMEGLEDEDMEDDLLEEGSDEGMDEEDDLVDPLTIGRGPKAHPTLDDEFFSIDAFNRMTEESEATLLSSGKLGGAGAGDDSEEDEEDDDLAGLLSGQASSAVLDGEQDVMYGDFFAPPPKDRAQRRAEKQAKPAAKGKGKGNVTIGDGKAATAPEPVRDIADYGRKTMNRVAGDLFGDDDEEDEAEALSTHEKRQLALREQIAALEQENVGPKDWTLLGEATSRARPENSLLEEDLEFEHVGKVVPVITEERVASLEDIIKKRILDNNFDDIVRRRELDDKAFLPSRFFELQDTQSARSLAQIYEDDYSASATAAAGGKVVDPRDAKLSKEHEDIDSLWGEISHTLDALSNLNYTPKQPKTAITTISNVASTTLESALPTTQSTSTMLAPEEMFQPPSASSLVARSELDPEQARKARTKRRKEKMHMRKGLDSAVDKFAGKGGGGGKARGGVRAEKDRALQELVKTGKGVTVIGKESVKKRGSKPADAATVQASRLKL